MGEEGSKPIWHLSRGGKQYGPISGQELLRLAEVGKLRPDDLLWKPGFAEWRTVRSIPGFLAPPPVPPQVNTPAEANPPIPASGQEESDRTSPTKWASQDQSPTQEKPPSQRAKEGNPNKKTAALFLSAFLFPGLWALDFTSMSTPWVLPDGRPLSRRWLYGPLSVIVVILLILLLIGRL